MLPLLPYYRQYPSLAKKVLRNRPEPIPHQVDNLICPIRAEEVGYLRSLEVQDKVEPSRLAGHLQGEAVDIHLGRFEGDMTGFDGCRLADGYGQKKDQGVDDNMRNMPKRIQSERKSVRDVFPILKPTEMARVIKSQTKTAHVPLLHEFLQTSKILLLLYLAIANGGTYCYPLRLQ